MSGFDIFLYIIIPFIMVGLFFFIINGIFRNTHNRTKVLINLFVGIFLLVFFTGALLLDWLVFMHPFKRLIKFLGFPISSAVLTLFLTITYYKRSAHGKNFYRSSKYKFRKDKVIDIESEDEEELQEDLTKFKSLVIETDDIIHSVYVVFQMSNKIILQRKGNILQGFKEQFSTLRPKDAIMKIISDFGFVPQEVQYIGQVAKHKELIFCYLIDISEFPQQLGEIEIINKFEVNDYNFLEEDKELVLRILIKEPFNIEK